MALPGLYIIAISGFVEKGKWGGIVALLAINLTAVVYLQTQNPFRRENWRQSVMYLKTEVQRSQNAVILSAFPEPFAPLRWYGQDLPIEAGLKGLKYEKGDELKIKEIVKTKPDIYLYEYLMDLTDPSRQIQKTLEQNDYKLVNQTSFTNMGFLYEYQHWPNATMAEKVQ